MFSNNFKESSARLIRTAGYPVIYRILLSSGYNVDTLSVEKTYDNYNIRACSMRNSYSDSQNPAYVEKIIKTYIISSKDLPQQPKTGDKIETPDSTVTVQRVQPYEYSGYAAAWKVVCTKD